MYHQITELYFKLVLNEQKQIANHPNLTEEFMIARVNRMNRYFENLTRSFAIMIDGMELNQFLQFRMALLPASGFQSAQYRMIEICATDFINLIDKNFRKDLQNNKDKKILFEKIYWKAGATELSSGKKTLTLTQFEKKYSDSFIRLAEDFDQKNLWRCYSKFDNPSSELKEALKEFDLNVNVNWPMVHMRSAARYLKKDPEVIAATGGTNWQKYLSPPLQKRIFYPELWSEEEIENWGRQK